MFTNPNQLSGNSPPSAESVGRHNVFLSPHRRRKGVTSADKIDRYGETAHEPDRLSNKLESLISNLVCEAEDAQSIDCAHLEIRDLVGDAIELIEAATDKFEKALKRLEDDCTQYDYSQD